MSQILPIFSTSASLKQGGVFTVERAGDKLKTGKKRGPVSLCDLAKEESLKQLHIVDSNFVSFFYAHKNLKEIGCQLVFGLKVVVCENMEDKSEASLKTESKVVIWMAGDGSEDYRALINLFTVAAQQGFYYVPRLDWKTLCRLWHKDLLFSLPFYSSFLAANTLTFSSIVPLLPVEKPILLMEDNELPTDGLLSDAVVRYAHATGSPIQPAKSVYYHHRSDARLFQIWRAVLSRGRQATWDKPNDGMLSREFCLDSWKEQTT